MNTYDEVMAALIAQARNVERMKTLVELRKTYLTLDHDGFLQFLDDGIEKAQS